MMKKNYEYILWDIDDTLIDFKKSQTASLCKIFADIGVTLSLEDQQIYSDINHSYWRRLELGEITKSEVLLNRFIDFCKYLNVTDADPAQLNTNFQLSLGATAVLYEHALELCTRLKKDYQQYVVTNGTKLAQDAKLLNTGLGDLMDGVFISEVVGFEKPSIHFFEHCFRQIPNFTKEKALIIGDSLTSDMQGANNAGIDCCWFNPNNQTPAPHLKLDYIISSLDELIPILLL